jgi:voltage-gated potassium channel
VIAPSTRTFLRRNWWQLIFLAVPFLRFMRPLARLRLPRLGRVVSSAVRTSRTATRKLSGRVTWLAALTLIVVLSASQIAHAYGDYDSYGRALHDTALSAITGEPLGQDAAVVQVLEIVLALYSVVVFAALAGSLGAFFLERRVDDEA